jgi:hypothetical protein
VEVLGLIKIDVLDDLRREIISGTMLSLQKLLIISRSSLAKDPRDRIYALLGLLKHDTNSMEGRVTIDYHKSTTDVHVDVMVHIFATSNGLYFLSGVSLLGLTSSSPRAPGHPAANETAVLPSWVPDFDHQVFESYIQLADTRFHPPATASASDSGADCMNGKVRPDMRTPQVEGLHIDVVSEVIQIPPRLEFMYALIDGLETRAAKQEHGHAFSTR